VNYSGERYMTDIKNTTDEEDKESTVSFIHPSPCLFLQRLLFLHMLREKKCFDFSAKTCNDFFFYQSNSNKTVKRNVIKINLILLSWIKINVSTVMGRKASELHWIMDIF
jgi:hypothetical protein